MKFLRSMRFRLLLLVGIAVVPVLVLIMNMGFRFRQDAQKWAQGETLRIVRMIVVQQ